MFKTIDVESLSKLPTEVVSMLKGGDYNLVQAKIKGGNSVLLLAIRGTDFIELSEEGAPLRKVAKDDIVAFEVMYQPLDSASRAFFKKMAAG